MRRAINLPRQKRSDLVVEEIKRWIVAEGKKPGDRLPQERDLIAIFGVSKGTVREKSQVARSAGFDQASNGAEWGSIYFQRVLRGYGRTTRELLLFYGDRRERNLLVTKVDRARAGASGAISSDR